MSSHVVVAGDPATADLVLGALDPEVARRETTCVLLGVDPEAVAAYAPGLAAARVAVAPGASLDAPPAALGPALLPHLGTAGTVLLDSSQAARDLAGWLAVSDGARVVWAVERVDHDGLCLTRMVYGGNARLRQQLPRAGGRVVALTKASALLSATAPPWRAPVTTLELAVPSDHGADVEGAGEVRLTGARIVIAVGRGVGGPERLPVFRRLADELGAALGATRVVVDQGWLSFAHQVGQTGATVAPELYLGFGISGAAQHLVGMRDSRAIVAINTDEDAPLCRIADLVVNADAFDVAARLVDDVRGDTAA